jgi:phosphopantetheinyl transferase (holo-ACP synthase)
MHVDLYIMPLADAPADWSSHLGPVCLRYQEKATTKAPEQTRLGEFAAGLLLASVLGVRADEQLTLGPEGKPELSAGSPRIGLSHDDAMAVLAVADGVVGVDVEEVPAQYGRLQREALRGVLSAEHIGRVESAPDPALSFALAWTRVEAVLKADGRGFAFDVRGGNLPAGWKTAHVLVDGHAVTCATREEPALLVHRLGMRDAMTLLGGEKPGR